MRSNTTKRGALLIAFALAAPGAALTTPALADHGVDDPAYIAQAGNGNGSSTPVISNLLTRTVLHDPLSFRLPPGTDKGAMRPHPIPCSPSDEAEGRCSSTFRRYLAFGTRPNMLGEPQLHMTMSDDGKLWDDPIPQTLQDLNGVDVPFTISDMIHFDVIFIPTAIDFQFSIYYARFDPADPNSIYDINNLRRALSRGDGIWIDNPCDLPAGPCHISQDAANPLVTGVAGVGFKRGSYGFTDVVLNPTGLTTTSCATVDPDGSGAGVPSALNCRFNGYINTTDGDLEYVTQVWSANGTLWNGAAAPSLSPGALGAWDDNAATLGKVLRTNLGGGLQRHTLMYSGWQLPDSACFDGMAGCASIGTATSTGLVTSAGWIATAGLGSAFVKSATNPATPRSLFELFGPDDPHTLWYPTPIDDDVAEHAKVYLTRITNANERAVFLAHTNPPPGLGPTVRFSNPEDGSFYSNATNLSDFVFYLTDTLGATVGVDLNTLVVEIDGNPVPGYTITDTIVTALKARAHEIRVAAALLSGLAVGTHTLSVDVEDLDGVLTSATATFAIEDGPPVVVITSSPASPRTQPSIAYGTGAFQATVTEGSGTTGVPPGTEILRVNVSITNQAGMVCNTVVPETALEKVGSGLDVNKKWRFTYSPQVSHRCPVPTSTPNPGTQYVPDEAYTTAFWAVGGNFTVSFLGEDIARNVESPTAANTRTILILT